MKKSFLSFNFLFPKKQANEQNKLDSTHIVVLDKATRVTFGASGSMSEAGPREIYDNDFS